MIRGTTPTLSFKLPFDSSIIDTVWITFSQRNTEMFTIETNGVQLDGDTITVDLTQQQTLSLLHDQSVDIQIRAKTVDGEAIASNILSTHVSKILKDGEI